MFHSNSYMTIGIINNMDNTKNIDNNIIRAIDNAFLDNWFSSKSNEDSINYCSSLVRIFGLIRISKKMKVTPEVLKRMALSTRTTPVRLRSIRVEYKSFLNNNDISEELFISDEYLLCSLLFTNDGRGVAGKVFDLIIKKINYDITDIYNLMKRWDLKSKSSLFVHHMHQDAALAGSYGRFLHLKKMRENGYVKFSGKYWVNKSGDVLKETPEGEARPVKILTRVNNYGKKSYAVSIDSKLIYIPKLLATHFIPNPNKYKYVRHTPKEEGTFILGEIEWIPSPRYKAKDV